jgi:hypothetical protein
MKEGERKEEDEREREKERETINYYYLPHKEREREKEEFLFIAYSFYTHPHTTRTHTPRSQHYFFRNPKNLQKLSSLKICPPLCNRARALNTQHTERTADADREKKTSAICLPPRRIDR